MTTPNKTANALCVCAALVMLGGCGSQAALNAPPAVQDAAHPFLPASDSTSYSVLFNFAGSSGSNPAGSLVAMNGLLYGTTYGGSAAKRFGTVFSIDTAGSEKVIYSFKGGKDGAHPEAALTALNGELYGTTYEGGANGKGTIFGVTIGGKARVLYSFAGASDGAGPETTLLSLHGKLYGTTYYGGDSKCGAPSGCGTVFGITTAGKESVIYRFQGKRDGAYPGSYLASANGVLYGVTEYGGGGGCYGRGCGTVFSVTIAGKERVLYRFKGGHSGEYPSGGLTPLNGTFYGTTYAGGSGGNGFNGSGTVFSITTAGAENILYSFQGGGDGAYPLAMLSALNGVLYGTTSSGGLDKCGYISSPTWCGTIFSVTPTGTEAVLYRFGGGNDGTEPNGLLALDGTLYGTTQTGGKHKLGTVFALTPP
jgi:uncharacterized repeat protein (TIGR03803 family)